MNFVYFVWLSRQGHHSNSYVTSRELCVSCLSVKKHMPNSNIFIYSRDGYKFGLDNFFDKYNIKVIGSTNNDLHGSYFNKIMFFRQALDDLSSFIFLDTDATFVRPMPRLKSVPLRFSRFIKSQTKSFTTLQMKFIKKYFGITKNPGYFRSTVVWVDQTAKKPFPWKKFRKILDNTIEIFKNKIEKEVPHRAKNRKIYYMDELYFSLAIHRLGLKVKSFNTLVLKDFTKYVLFDWADGQRNKEFKIIYKDAFSTPEIKQFF